MPYSIVIVDDEPWTLIWLRELFHRPDLGFTVLDAKQTAVDALEIIEKERPDVVITDIRMPEMSGIELMQYLRKREIDSEMIVVSGMADFSFAQEAIHCGVFDYLIKPVDEEMALTLLERLEKRLSAKVRPAPPAEEAEPEGVFEQMLDDIHKNYTGKLTLKELAAKYYLNANYCSTLFQVRLGMSFSQYITELRMKQAVLLLSGRDIPIRRITTMVGYEDYFYFNKLFKKKMGVSPSCYRKEKLAEKKGAAQ